MFGRPFPSADVIYNTLPGSGFVELKKEVIMTGLRKGIAAVLHFKKNFREVGIDETSAGTIHKK